MFRSVEEFIERAREQIEFFSDGDADEREYLLEKKFVMYKDLELIHDRLKIFPNGCFIFPPYEPLGIFRAVNAPVTPMIYRSGLVRHPGPGSGATYLTHLLVWDVFLGTPEHGRSYVCKTLYCCNPAHMVDEPEDVKLTRIGCQGKVVGYVLGHEFVIDACPHNPKCLHTTNLDSLDIYVNPDAIPDNLLPPQFRVHP